MKNLEKARRIMIENHLKARGLKNPAVLQAMSEVAREAFLPKTMAEFAYGPFHSGFEPMLHEQRGRGI
jgi:protein-L-isoaspartate(D-aspartate) O-methyltransferase